MSRSAAGRAQEWADSQTPKYTTTDAKVRLRTAATVTMTRTVWLWDGRVPIGGVTMAAGLEGLGKTLVLLDAGAKATRGTLAGSRRGRPGHCVYVGHEDDWASVVLPRLVASGADLSMVHFVEVPAGSIFAVEDHVADLEAAMEGLDGEMALVIIDPLDAHLGENIDSHRKSEVQRSVSRLAELAQRRDCAVVGVGHLNKNELSRDVLTRVIGSKGFTTGPRSVLAVGVHPDDERDRLLVLAKANLTDKASVPALRFRIEGCTVPHDDGGTVDTARVVWLGEEHGVDPNSIVCCPSAEERTERDECADWLRDLLEDGKPRPYREVERLALEAGHSRATLHRARRSAGVVVERDDNAQGRPSSWRLPFGINL